MTLTKSDIEKIITWLELFEPDNTNPDESDDNKELDYLLKKLYEEKKEIG